MMTLILSNSSIQPLIQSVTTLHWFKLFFGKSFGNCSYGCKVKVARLRLQDITSKFLFRGFHLGYCLRVEHELPTTRT